MTITRPPYGPDSKFVEVPMMFSARTMKVPVLDYPISVKENFKRAAERNNPVWVPNSMTDLQTVDQNDLCGIPMPEPKEGEEAAPASPWGANERMDFTDAFGCVWTFVPEAGGPMLKPNHPPRLADITEWEKEIVWPSDEGYDYIGAQTKFMEKTKGVDKVLHINIGQSCTERLVALLGGYTEAMVAMAEEPEAVKDFLMAFAEYTKNSFLKMTQVAKVDFVTFHDDWGTEKDTFFSEKMMEDMVFEPSKLIIDAIKAHGANFQLHSCGNIGRFVPYMIDMGVDFIQLQRRANDVPALKEKYGDKIGFNVSIEGLNQGQIVPVDELKEKIRNTVDLYGKGGGLYTSVYAGSDEDLWDATQELFCYSREYYAK